MEVFRLVREKNSFELSGLGSAINGARWNSKGVEMIYTSVNRALAMAEVLVHFTAATLPSDFVIMKIHIPDEIDIQVFNVVNLSDNWNRFPLNPETQLIGDKFISEKKYCLLKVPSVVVREEFNILINPKHKDFKKIQITSTENFQFDDRFFQ